MLCSNRLLEAVRGAVGAEPPQLGQVPAVHGDQQGEGLEVAVLDLARAQRLQLVAAQQAGGDGTLVRRLADVPVAEAAGIDRDLRLQAALGQALAQDRLGGGGTADVPGAHEKNADSGHDPSD